MAVAAGGAVLGLIACFVVSQRQRMKTRGMRLDVEDQDESPPDSPANSECSNASRPLVRSQPRELACFENGEEGQGHSTKRAPRGCSARSSADLLFDAIDTDNDGVITKKEYDQARWLVDAVQGMNRPGLSTSVRGSATPPVPLLRESSGVSVTAGMSPPRLPMPQLPFPPPTPAGMLSVGVPSPPQPLMGFGSESMPHLGSMLSVGALPQPLDTNSMIRSAHLSVPNLATFPPLGVPSPVNSMNVHSPVGQQMQPLLHPGGFSPPRYRQ
jgi:hypothetical protein